MFIVLLVASLASTRPHDQFLLSLAYTCLEFSLRTRTFRCLIWSKQTKDHLLNYLNQSTSDMGIAQRTRSKRLERWKLYRISLKVISDGLKTFESTKRLVAVIADTMEGEYLYHHLPKSNVLKATRCSTRRRLFLILGFSNAILS